MLILIGNNQKSIPHQSFPVPFTKTLSQDFKDDVAMNSPYFNEAWSKLTTRITS